MGSKRQLGSLEITQDLVYQQRTWLIQRIAWAGMLLFLLVALLGLFGSGLFSTATLDSPERLRIRYERFGRFERPMFLRIEITPSRLQTGEIQLRLDQAYMQHLSLESISPEPLQVESTSDQIIYSFAYSRSQTRVPVTFYLVPEQIGLYRGQISLDDQTQLEFRQFVYP